MRMRKVVHGRPMAAAGARREAAVVGGLVAVALVSVWMLFLLGGRTKPAARATGARPKAVVPSRVPYDDLVYGRVKVLDEAARRVEVSYDFEPLPLAEGRFYSEDDRYPQLNDWNAPARGWWRSRIPRFRGKIAGSARTRLAFVGDVEVAADMEMRGRAASIMLATNRVNEGYECLLAAEGDAAGSVALRARRVERRGAAEPEADDERGGLREVVTDLAGPAAIEPPPLGRRMAVVFARAADRLSVAIDGRELVAASVPDDARFDGGNVSLLAQEGTILWESVRIVGTLSPEWIDSRMSELLSFTGPDQYESDDVWTTAREIQADGTEQARTMSPDGDVDWALVVVPEGTSAVRVETCDIGLGIDTELAAFAADGVGRLEARPAPAAEAGAATLLVEARGLRSFCVRVSEREGRRGSYALRAAPVGGMKAFVPGNAAAGDGEVDER